MTDVIPVHDPKSRYRIEPTVMQALRSPRLLTREVLAGLVVAIALIPEAIAVTGWDSVRDHLRIHAPHRLPE